MDSQRIQKPLNNFIVLGAGEILARILAFLSVAVLTRKLGAAGFGELSFCLTLAGYLIFVPIIALQDLGIRAVSMKTDESVEIVSSLLKVFTIISGLGLCGIVAISMIFPQLPSTKTLLILCGLALIPQCLNISWAYKALERTALASISLIFTQICYLAFVFLVIDDNDDLNRAPLILGASELLATVILSRMVWSGWKSGSLKKAYTLLSGAWVIILNRFLRALIVSADIIMLGIFVTTDQVGLYSVAYKICFFLLAIGASASIVFQPKLMRVHGDTEKAAGVLSESIWLSWSVGLPLIVGGIIVAPDLLVLLFGKPFAAADTALRILLISTGFLFLQGSMNGIFLALNKLKMQTLFLAIAACTNLILNAFLIIPHGIMGAALATAISELMFLTFTAGLVWKHKWLPGLPILIKPALAGLLMCISLLYFMADWHVLLRIIGGGVVYLTFLVLSGDIPIKYIRSIKSVISRRK
jgi:O-antigen/teichoic acid export membrane protein